MAEKFRGEDVGACLQAMDRDVGGVPSPRYAIPRGEGTPPTNKNAMGQVGLPQSCGPATNSPATMTEPPIASPSHSSWMIPRPSWRTRPYAISGRQAGKRPAAHAHAKPDPCD